MKFHNAVITKHFSFDAQFNTLDGLSHAKVTKFENEISDAIKKSNEYLVGLLKSIELEHSAALEMVGK